MNAEREARLPHWAQDELARLRRRVDALATDIAERDDKIDNPSVFLWDQPHDRPLPDRSVRFLADPVRVGALTLRDRCYIDVRRQNGGVSIHGSHSITVSPESGNHVQIKLADR